MSFYFSGSLSTANVNIEKQGGIVFNDDDSSNTLSILPPNAITDNFSLKLPAADGSANQVLKTDGSGNLSFTNQASGAGGSNTQLQYNNSGSLGGIEEFTYASGDLAIGTEGSFTVSADTEIDLTTIGTLDINANTLDMDLTDSSAITITSSEAGEDLTIEQVGANDSSIIITAAGTGTDAIKIDATAGSMLIGPSLADGQTLKLGKNGATEMVFTPHGTAASEKISLTNTNGIASDAIAITASAGGFSIDAVQASDITLASAGDADDLTIAVTGSNDASLLLSSTGTGADAVSIDASAGSMVIAPSLADGQTLKLGKNGATEMVFTPSGTAADEKISLTNTSGNASDAIAITASAGGFSIDAVQASDITLASAGDADDLTIAVTGSNDASLLLSSTGTGADAVSIDATAGSMVIAPSLADGQTLKLGKNGATEMVFTPHGTPANEKISLTNSTGTAADAIDLTATAGGITLDGSLVTKVSTVTIPDISATLSDISVVNNNSFYLNLTDSTRTNTNGVIVVAGTAVAGQHLNLFFDNGGSNTLQIDFGATNLASGSGLARYLKFSQTGQSASLMYVGSKWRIINTGAAVS